MSFKYILFICLLSLFMNCNNTNNNIVSSHLNIYKKAFENSIKYNGTDFKSYINFLPLKQNTKFPLIILRYSEKACGSCIEEGLTLLEELKNEGYTTIIFCSYQNEHHLQIFQKRRNISIETINIPEDILNIFKPYEDTKVPYIFFLDSKFSVYNFFAINYNVKNIIPEYFKIIVGKEHP